MLDLLQGRSKTRFLKIFISRGFSFDVSVLKNVAKLTKSRFQILQLYGIWQWLPVRIAMYEPQLIYTTDEHGCSLSTFFNKVEQYEPVLMIIKATTGEVISFNAYVAYIIFSHNSFQCLCRLYNF